MISRAARFAVLAGLIVVAGTASAQQPQKFDPVGRWRFFHTDGTPFTARLAADQTATTDWGGGEHGIWRWEAGKVRMIYTDGWDDLLSVGTDGHFIKQGWSPDADRCAAASNQTGVERLSTDPGPPL